MLSFETYITRYGEAGLQAIIERLERYEGIAGSGAYPLEERWEALMVDRRAERAEAA